MRCCIGAHQSHAVAALFPRAFPPLITPQRLGYFLWVILLRQSRAPTVEVQGMWYLLVHPMYLHTSIIIIIIVPTLAVCRFLLQC
jgi:hypothetical protein